MGGIEGQAAFYRGYLIDDQSLAPLAVALATMVALWSLVYLVGCFAPGCEAAGERTRGAIVRPRRLAHCALTPRRAQPNFGGARSCCR